jgi:DNA replication protein DnaC
MSDQRRPQHAYLDVTSQQVFEQWHNIFGGQTTTADAICDRLTHSAIKLHLERDSMRKIKIKSAQNDRRLGKYYIMPVNSFL